jgi:hypothetical protein
MLLLFKFLLVAQCLVVIVHDMLEIPGWTHGSQVLAAVGRKKFWAAAAINSVFPLTAVVVVIFAWGSHSFFARNYPLVYCSITVISAIAMWYVPYFFGASEETKRTYTAMYEGTRQVFPARKDHPRPNLLHVCFHLLFIATFSLSIALYLKG